MIAVHPASLMQRQVMWRRLWPRALQRGVAHDVVDAGGRTDTPSLASNVVAPWADLRPRDLTSVELVVSSFRSFRDVGRFVEVLLAAPGVQATYLRRLQQGVLQVRVEYRSTASLPELLRDACMPAFPFHVVSHEAHRIEVVLDDKVDRAEEVTCG